MKTEPSEKRAGSPIALTGFAVLCAWHYLVMFTAIPTLDFMGNPGRLYLHQVVLLACCGLSYLLIAFLGKRIDERIGRLSNRRQFSIAIGTGLLGTVASFLCILFATEDSARSLIFFGLLGLTEAPLMFPWLRLARFDNDSKQDRRNLTVNMGFGGACAFFIACLEAPYSHILFALLPLLSQISYNEFRKGVDGHNASSSRKTISHLSLGEAFKGTLQFAVLGLAFGIFQVALSISPEQHSHLTFTLNNAWPLCGIVASAFILRVATRRSDVQNNIFTVQRVSVFVIMIGVFFAFYLVLVKNTIEPISCVTQMLFLAGFNTFDFGFMIYSFSWAQQLGKNYSQYIGFNRAALYLSTCFGLLVSLASLSLMQSMVFPQYILIVIASLGLFLLSLPFLEELAPFSTRPSRTPLDDTESAQAEAQTALGQPEDDGIGDIANIDDIATRYHLSKREGEILLYLYKGYDVPAIQQELWISVNTIKTHVSHIYRKIDVHSHEELIDLLNSTLASKKNEVKRRDMNE